MARNKSKSKNKAEQPVRWGSVVETVGTTDESQLDWLVAFAERDLDSEEALLESCEEISFFQQAHSGLPRPQLFAMTDKHVLELQDVHVEGLSRLGK
jgi:hypothetical protein